MSLNPSLALIPCAFDTGKLYSVLPEDGSGDFSVSRNGNASYFDKNGILRTALPNEPRFDFDPLTGEFRGVLVEPAATNLLLRSLYFESSNWFIQGNRISRTFNSDIAPDGTLSATKFTRVINGDYLIRQTLPSNLFTLGSTWTYSVWVKAIDQDITVTLDISDRGLQSFSVTPQEDWKRISATHTWTDTFFNNVGPFFDIVLTNLSLNNSHLLWGAQLEAGSVATSYIPTGASTVTRPADVITRTNAQDLIGQTEGTVYGEFEIINQPFLADHILFRITSNNNLLGFNGFNFTLRICNRDRFILSINDSAIRQSLGNIQSFSGRYKYCVTYNINQVRYFINGIFRGSLPTQNLLINGLNDINVGHYNLGITQLGNPHKNFYLLKKSLTDAQAIALTTL